MRRLLLLLGLATGGLVVVATPAHAAGPVNTAPPSISGTAVYAGTLTADPGQWTPTPTSYAYRWLRDGHPIKGAIAASYTPGLQDIGHTVAVRVAASDGTGGGSATSDPTGPVQRADIVALHGLRVTGVPRYTHSLVAHPGRFSVRPSRLRYRWLTQGTAIPGATGTRYAIAPQNLGHRLRAEVSVKAPGYHWLTVRTARTHRVGYRVGQRRVVRYHIETRGHVTASLARFARQAQQTYDDARGWRSSGVAFRRVAHGGSMTLVLAEASTVPSFSSACSSTWSCRVGRYVIINQTRWLTASPAWNAAHLARRDYRDMVVNHETGHFLGLAHSGCPGPGRLAPVMMQQSKGLDGCRFNPWPTLHELASRTPPGRGVAARMVPGYPRVWID